MSASNAMESSVLDLILNAAAWAGIADNAGSPDANNAVSLHTSDPGEGGTLATNETSYGSYARATIARDSGSPAWSISGSAPTSASPGSDITFATGSGGSQTVTYFAIGRPSGGSATMHLSGTVTPNLNVGSGITPSLTTATTITCD